MDSATERLCGTYLGRREVREGRQDEVSPKERRALAKGEEALELVLSRNGTFSKQVTEGTWKREGDRVRFTPRTFNGDTLEAMRDRTEAMGRRFGLAFLFDPFELQIEGADLSTPDDGSPIFTKFVWNSS